MQRLLLCIAVCPLVIERWWDKNKQYAVILWSLAFVIPFIFYAGAHEAFSEVLETVFGDYITFIVLLFGLFCVAGNICLEGDLVGKPKLNVLLLTLFFILDTRAYKKDLADGKSHQQWRITHRCQTTADI